MYEDFEYVLRMLNRGVFSEKGPKESAPILLSTHRLFNQICTKGKKVTHVHTFKIRIFDVVGRVYYGTSPTRPPPATM